MAQNQLDVITALGKKPIYDIIDLSTFRPEYTGKIRVRVNPPRAIRKRIDAANDLLRELTDQRNALAEGADTTEIEEKEKALGQEFNALAASLIPISDTDPTPLTVEQLDKFFEGDEETDDTLQRWFMQEVWSRVYTYFLSPLTLRRKET